MLCLIWTAITLYITPIIKGICADANAPPFPAFKVTDFAQDNAFTLILNTISMVILFEWKAGKPAVCAADVIYSIGTAVFLINTAAILCLGSLLSAAPRARQPLN